MPVKASCHCGAVQFELAEAPTEVTSCNCTFCSRRGALYAYYAPEQARLLTARDRVATYQWGHYVGQHHHCGVCGIGTHSEFPDFSSGKPDYEHMKIGINARLIEGFDVAALPVRHVDGRHEW